MYLFTNRFFLFRILGSRTVGSRLQQTARELRQLMDSKDGYNLSDSYRSLVLRVWSLMS